MPNKLTPRRASAVLPGKRVFDSEPQGFGVRGAKGGNYWIYRYSLAGRRTELVIGRCDSHGIEAARTLARRAAALKAQGIDPIAERARRKASERFQRLAAAASAARPTLTKFADRFMDEWAKPQKKASSIASDQNILDTTLLPALGELYLAEIGLSDVSRFHADLRATPYRANRALALLSTMLARAEQWGERPLGSNPCKAVKRYPEKKRERFLSPSETAALVEVLAKASGELRDHADAIHLLLLTGCRKGEVAGLRWCEVDLDAGRLGLEDSKTGRRTIPLAFAALALLKWRHVGRYHDGLVFSQADGSARTGLDQTWREFRKAAKLPDVRIHDLRHSFASAGIAAGLSLPEIGRLLGHKAAATTARYSHVGDEVARAAVDRIGEHLAEVSATGKPRLRIVA